jgi:glucose/arabinose dehydrogenase
MALPRVHRVGRLALALAAAVVLGAAACGGDDEEAVQPSPPPAQSAPESGGLLRSDGPARLETVVTGLEVPWDMAFLPDGRALVTERPGRVRLLSRDLGLRDEPVAEVEVAAIGEGGLLGIAVDPDFADNSFVYLYRTTGAGNEVVRFRFDGEQLIEDEVVVEGIQAGAIHDGGRIRFGPDDALYVTTGDAGQDQLAQDPGSLNGKILRVDGGRTQVYSLGHRNPQGLDWQPGSGRLVAAEHGPAGDDEVNLIEPGRNYGWPDVTGAEHGDFAAPAAVYEDSIAPSGATFVSLVGSAWTGDFLIGALVGEQVRRLSFDGARVTRDEALFEGELGRVRVLVEGPDGALYALTSNRDGRGAPREEDDRIVRIVPPAG